MNCDEFRQAVAEDPAGGFAGEPEHAADCAECRAYRSRLQRFDNQILGALEVAVPALKFPDLADTVVPLTRQRIWRNPVWLGLAASVALLAVFAINWLQIGASPQSLTEQIIAHLDHEPGALVVTDVAISDGRFAAVARPALVDMDRSIGLISYAMSCKINGHEVPHLVVQGAKGPITILLMPEEFVAAATAIEGASIEGMILPVGKGSIAIIGTRGEALEHWHQQVLEKVHWKT